MIKNYVDQIRGLLIDIENDIDYHSRENFDRILKENRELESKVRDQERAISALELRVAQLGLELGRMYKDEI